MEPEFVPEILGKYSRRELLGKGTSAFVYKAVNEDIGKVVALKVFRPDTAVTPAQLEAHRQEAVFGARLDHPNIASVLDALVMAMLAKEPEDRALTARDVSIRIAEFE